MKTKFSFLSPEGHFTVRSAFILFIALALSSCTKEVIDSPAMLENETSAIGFGTFLDRTSQPGIRPLSSLLDKGGLQTSGFKVLAYSTEVDNWSAYSSTAPATPNFMDDQNVGWDGSAWTYTPPQNWPKVNNEATWGKVSFFAHSIADGATATGVAGGKPQILFETQATAAAQVDLVADAELDKTGADGTVKFAFEHLLSRIGFTVKLDADYDPITIKIKSLKVYYAAGKVSSAGTYTFSSTDNLADGNWALAGAAKFEEKTTGAGDEVYSTEETLTTTALPLSAPDNYLMLIPQALATGDMYVELEYEVTDDVTETFIPKIEMPAVSGGWKPGKAYTYNIVLKPDIALDDVEIGFDADIDVNPWVDAPEVRVYSIKRADAGSTALTISRWITTLPLIPIAADVEWDVEIPAEYASWLLVEAVGQTKLKVSVSSNLKTFGAGSFTLKPKDIPDAVGLAFTVNQSGLGNYGDALSETEGTQDPATGYMTITSGRVLTNYSDLRPFGGRWTITFESITMAANDELTFYLMNPTYGHGMNAFFRPSNPTPWNYQISGGGSEGNPPIPEWSLEKTVAMRKIEVLVGSATLPCPLTTWIDGVKVLDMTQTAGNGWPASWCGGVGVTNNSSTLSVVVKSFTYEPL